MLIVISLVTSAIVRTSRPRFRQASRRVSARSRGLRDPIAGGTVSSSGPSTSASPSSQASHFGIASASFLDHLDTSSWLRFASSAYNLIDPPSGNAW
jgi:hypothetical protein